jgi:hypothetical protein
MSATRRLLSPLLAALALEVDYAPPQSSPWCAEAQRVLAKLPPADAPRLSIHTDYLNESHPFEHTRVHCNRRGSRTLCRRRDPSLCNRHGRRRPDRWVEEP